MHFHQNHEEEDDESMLLLTLWPPDQQNPNISYTSPWNSSSTSAIDSAFSFPSEPSDLTNIALSIAPPGVSSNSDDNPHAVTPGSGSRDSSQYWIPSPSEILVSTRQYSCTVCHRKFKRFNNMQMHMWGHGSQYRQGNDSALRSLNRPGSSSTTYSCRPTRLPCYCWVEGCKSNISHPRARPLKDLRTLQIHYRRKHCPRQFICRRCGKLFAVRGDWQTHQKNCGRVWFCICGSNFKHKRSLKDHISSFGNGHAPHMIESMVVSDNVMRSDDDGDEPGDGDDDEGAGGDGRVIADDNGYYGYQIS